MRTNVLMTAIVALLAMGLGAFAADEMEGSYAKGNRTLQLSGSGLSAGDFGGNKLSLQVEAAQFFMDEVAVALRQGVDYDHFGSRAIVAGSTALAADWFWPLEMATPLAGVSAGYVYGNRRAPELFLGPEVGVRKSLGETAFVNLMAEYLMYYDRGETMPAERWSGRFEYTLGLGVLY